MRTIPSHALVFVRFAFAQAPARLLLRVSLFGALLGAGGCMGTTQLSYGPKSGWVDNSQSIDPCDTTTSPYEQAARCR